MDAPSSFSDPSIFPLATLDPAAPLDDLAPLASIIDDDVRVIAIGESAHGAHEFYALRHRIIRLLVENLNFTAVVWESGFPEAFLVDDYIHSRHDDREQALTEGMTMHMGRCQEMASLLDWLRRYNAAAAAPPVQFYGLDLPASSASLAPVVETVAKYLQRVDPGCATRLSRLRELAAKFRLPPAAAPSKLTLVGSAALQHYTAMPAEQRNEMTSLLADLSARFDALRRVYVERSDADQYNVMRHHLLVAAQLDLQLRAVAALLAGDLAACEANIRDLTMSHTMNWILSRERRVIVLAHNGHIQRTPISTYAGPIDTLGVHLAHTLGNRYLAIGTTCGAGDIIIPRTTMIDGAQQTELVIRTLPAAPDDSIDRLLQTRLGQMALLDLRTLSSQPAAAIDATQRMRMQNQMTEIHIRQAFDLLIHIPRISLWTSETTATMTDLRAAEQTEKH